MRRAIPALLLCLACFGLVSCATTGRGTRCVRDLSGTWELVEPLDSALRQVKLLTPGHFTWVTYARETGQVVAVGGGAWSCDADGYVERVDYATDNVAAGLVGREQRFSCERSEDLWAHEGDLTNGAHVRELWRRVEIPDGPTPAAPPASRPGRFACARG